jgi:hypothetical protein
MNNSDDEASIRRKQTQHELIYVNRKGARTK